MEKKKKSKARTKYCDKNPVIRMQYNQVMNNPTKGPKCGKEPFIKNGNSLLPKLYKKKKYTFEDTSAIDCLTKVFSHATQSDY